MDIQIKPILIEQKSVLIQLMELYNYEFSEYEDEDINDYGYYGYSHIDDYWNEAGRFPYMIWVDNKIAGFALICSHCECSQGNNPRCFGEFFVMLKYRKKGIGKFVAKSLFDKHRGDWEVLQLPLNNRARSFWKSVVHEYTNGIYSECETFDKEKVGFLFCNNTTK